LLTPTIAWRITSRFSGFIGTVAIASLDTSRTSLVTASSISRTMRGR